MMEGLSYSSPKRARKVDFGLLLAYLFLVVFGWLNIYSAVYSEEHSFILDFSQRYGLQFIWICISLGVAIVLLYMINPSHLPPLSPILYLVMLVLLAAVIFLGREVNGSRSWFFIGSFGLQPAEFSKITTALLLSYMMSQYGFSLANRKDALKAALVVIVPILLILMEKETGSALVYIGLILVFYMEGLAGWVIVLGLSLIAIFVITIAASPLTALACAFGACCIIRFVISRKLIWTLCAIPVTVLMFYIPTLAGTETFAFLANLNPEVWALILMAPFLFFWIRDLLFRKEGKGGLYLLLCLAAAVVLTFSVDLIFEKVLQPHQKARIENLLGITEDLQGIGYNVHQSKIAIGSGGLTGKGFLNGTQTKYNFVPEQSTDFIFCTVGEEWGFLGSLLLLGVYIFLITRIIHLSSKNPDAFTRIYGYCVASIFLMHVVINMGMTMGLLPVIGIPLPFLSYGGSSMMSFTILLFIFIRLDMERQNKDADI
ncbi:MAG: rod shape-determining protein RodA [Bacteroidales bacterium]|nr:rod shape-determining protein RodA [Bacteroidales bacterium]